MSRRTVSRLASVLASALLALVLGAALLAAPTAAHDARADARAEAGPNYQPYGRAYAPDQTLRNGCRNYVIKWRIRPPTPEWSARIIVFAPKGRKIYNLYLDVNKPDPRIGQGTFRTCRSTVRPGRFKAQLRLVYNDGPDTRYAATRPTYFQMRRP